MNPALVSSVASSVYRRKRIAEVPAVRGNNIQHTESSSRSRSSTVNACDSRKEAEEKEETFGYCFSLFDFEVKEWFWKRQRNTKKCVEVNYLGIFLLPDDILEMCLNRLPHTSLKNARLVCKKWSSLIIECRLLQIRKYWRYENLWLFVFGTIKDADWSSTRDNNKIHALDLSRNEWHAINADFLKGRFRFSVAGIRDGICIVGGVSNNKNPLKRDSRLVSKIHKEVMFFNPVTKSCHNLQSMKYARYDPILGVTEHSIIRRRCCLLSSKRIKRSFLLIVVGGTDDKKLMHCGEMYDSLTNKWTEIQRLPSDFRTPYSGIVCGKMFYVISTSYKLAAYDIEKGFWFAIQTSSIFPPWPPPVLPKLVSSNGRLYMVSNCWSEGRETLVTTLWELDLMHLTWTEISTDPYVNIDWRSANFVANENLIFGIPLFEPRSPRHEILDSFSICDVSEPNMAKWSNISTNFVANMFHQDSSFRDRCMVAIHVNI